MSPHHAVLTALFTAACWRGDVPVAPPPPAIGVPGERLATTPIDPAGDGFEEDQRLEVSGLPWREVAVMRREGQYDLVLATQSGRFAVPLDGQVDGLIVDEIALHSIVPGRRPWVVVTYDSVHDGGKITQLVACQAGPGDNPECTQPLVIEHSDLRDEPNWRVEYPRRGGIALVPLGGGPPRQFSF